MTTTATQNLSKLPPPGKDCICFQTEGKTFLSAQCAKLIASTKVMETIFETDLAVSKNKSR